MGSEDVEHELTGGNHTARVVRIGTTVRKPVTEATADVERYLRYLSNVGFAHAPRSLGRDGTGRQMLEFIEGETIHSPHLLTVQDLEEIAAVVRELHRVSAGFPVSNRERWNVPIQPDAEELICHNDLGAWNLVRSGTRWVFIDWDCSGPSSRMWDLAYAAQAIVHLAEGGDPARDADRLRRFVDAYGMDEDERRRFPELLWRRTQANYEFLKSNAARGVEPWARMYAAGHGAYWQAAAAYLAAHQQVWLAALL